MATLSLYDSFSLSRRIVDVDPILLVPSGRWLSLSIEGEYRKVDTRAALLALDDVAHLRREDLRHFVAQTRLDTLAVNRMDDLAVLASVRQAIRSRCIVAIHKATEPPSSSATVELRRLVAQVEKATRSRLAHRGRQYKLVADVDLAKMPGRDGYEVASQAEAQAVLASAAKDSPASADFLRQAATKLSKDWHPPGDPEGLVLMRRIVVQAAAAKDTGPAITPSQMEALLDADKRVAFFARFDDDPEYKLRWDIDLGIHLSPVTPLGAAHRLGRGEEVRAVLARGISEERGHPCPVALRRRPQGASPRKPRHVHGQRPIGG